jgi:SAM-dependent methyltransferase
MSEGSDDVNRPTWSRPETLADYADLNAFTDVAERQLLLHHASEIRGRAILDVGAGAGRSASFLRLLSDDYVAVDYTPEMVRLFEGNHPGVDVRHGDARDLSMFADGRFGFATFSFNGIDSVDRDGRLQILHELRRVLGPNGLLLFSTHNKEGPGPRHRPWRGVARSSAPGWYRALRWAAKLPLDAPRHVRSWRSWLRYRRLDVDRGDWSIQVSATHDFSILMYHTTLRGLLADLDAVGFIDVETYAREDGRKVSLGDDVSDVLWFQVVARTP